MKHPRWCLKFITPAEIHAVTNAVKAAEAGTTADIVPMIVSRSTSLGHFAFQIFTLLCLAVAGLYAWLEHTEQASEYVWVLMALIFFLWPASEYLQRWPFLQRLYVSPRDREWHVHARATLEFYQSGFQKTKDHTGILIFLSLMERKCVVLADEGIAAKLPPETWSALVDTIVSGIKTGRPAHGLTAAIQQCGQILTKHFPASGKHENQLPNQLIIKD